MRINPNSLAGWLRKGRRALIGFSCLSLATAIAPPAVGQAPNDSAADALKAAFIFNFAKFTAWPEVDDLDITVQFCIQKNTIDAEVFDGWGLKQVQKRPVRVTFYDTFDKEKLSTCSVLFVGSDVSELQALSLMTMAKEESILLVSNQPGFAERGGQIELFLADRKLRFKVNLDSVNDANLSLGAGVLRLAEIVSTTEVMR